MSNDKDYSSWGILNSRYLDKVDLGVYRIKQDIRGRWDVEVQCSGSVYNHGLGSYENRVGWRHICTHKYKWQARRAARRLKNPKIEYV